MYVYKRNLEEKKKKRNNNAYIGRTDEKRKRPKKRRSHYISPMPIMIIKSIMGFILQYFDASVTTI